MAIIDAAVIDRIYNDGMNIINKVGDYAVVASDPGHDDDAAQVRRLRVIASALISACDQIARMPTAPPAAPATASAEADDDPPPRPRRPQQ